MKCIVMKRYKATCRIFLKVSKLKFVFKIMGSSNYSGKNNMNYENSKYYKIKTNFEK